MTFRRVALGVAASALTALAVGCGGSDDEPASGTESSKDPVTILSVTDTTGPGKVYGANKVAALKGAADYFNEKGGIDGRKVEIKSVSDNGDPATAVQLLVKNLSEETPTAVDAGLISSEVSAMIPILAKRDVFAISSNDGNLQCASDAETKCPNQWTMTPPRVHQQTVAADWMKEEGIKKVGILEMDYDYAKAETPDLLVALKERGIDHELVQFPANAVDLTGQMQQLKQAGTDAVYVEAIGPPAGYALKARAKLEWDVPVLFDASASSLDITTLAPKDQVKDSYALIWWTNSPENQDHEGIQAMLKYSKEYGDVTQVPLSVAASGWDTVVLLKNAIEQSGGSVELADLNKAMLEMSTSEDPLYTYMNGYGWEQDNHENVGVKPGQYLVVPVGPIKGGTVQPPE